MFNESLAIQISSETLSNGFVLAIAILVLMIGTVIYSLVRVFWIEYSEDIKDPLPSWRKNAMIILLVTGMAIALYLSYIEITSVKAFCGPVGNCNTVQSSKYARLFGVLPIGLLGFVGYVLMLMAWIFGRNNHPKIHYYSRLAFFGMALFGVLFSIYLTYLEPFVIKAVCIWCLSSALIMTLILLNSLPEIVQVLNQDLD